VQGILNHEYDGNSWWAFLGAGATRILVYWLLSLRTLRRTCQSVSTLTIVAACVWFAGFVAWPGPLN
jgi:ABC-type branched-subunit amino acid transport system permease subunit